MSENNDDAFGEILAIVDGDPVHEAVLVDTTTSETIQDLREAIMITIYHHPRFHRSYLRDIAVNKVQLWKVNLPNPPPHAHVIFQGAGNEVVQLDNLKTKFKLELAQRVGHVFRGGNNTPNKGLTLVVVKIVDQKET
ncbi:hypothetical protein BGZ95_009910 [Linnemannia exigua]|uniref:Uncharacterized protein n=1 Tax=Linnemannia exigua TaxID=604196 RepID=A0AAD4DC78_9FUNG|nr:hypothetical protein BGZ95_009910 [Linnemannia exigua]